MTDHNFDYLQTAHKNACELVNDLVPPWRNQQLKIVHDIESFVRFSKEPDVLRQLHETRHRILPETKGK